MTDRPSEIIERSIRARREKHAREAVKEAEEQNGRLQRAIDRDIVLDRILHSTCGNCNHSIAVHMEDRSSKEAAEPRFVSRCRAAPWDKIASRAVACECRDFVSSNEETKDYVTQENARFVTWVENYFGG